MSLTLLESIARGSFGGSGSLRQTFSFANAAWLTVLASVALSLVGIYAIDIAERPFTDDERQHWGMMLQTAAMRFWLSRLETYHGLDAHNRDAGVTVLKDPDAIRDILLLRQQHQHPLPA